MTEYSVQLRIESATLDPDSVTTRLGLQPSLVRVVGEWIGPKQFEKALWNYSIPGNKGEPSKPWSSLEEGLWAVIAQLEPYKAQIKEYRKDHRVYWWCGAFAESTNSGTRLSVEVLQTLADFGAELVLDTYLDTEESESLT